MTDASLTSKAGPLRRARSQMAPLVKTTLLNSGGYTLLRRLVPSRRIAILRYHAICGADGYAYADPTICISPDKFEAHVAYFAAHYAVLPLPEIVARVREGRSLPFNTLAITFDDGYADNLAAARVLAKYGLSATFYITAGCLAGDEPFWPSELRYLLKAIPDSTLSMDVAGQSIAIPLTTAAERQSAVRKLTRLFKSNRIPVRDALREQLRVAAGRPALPRHMLQWEELAEMHRLGMTIGAHTLTHANLPSAGAADAAVEIVESKARLERELSTPVTMFSYPNGGAETYYTPELQQLVARAGFSAATSSHNAFAAVNSDLYALERIEVEERLEDIVFALEVERFAFRPQPTDNTPWASRPTG